MKKYILTLDPKLDSPAVTEAFRQLSERAASPKSEFKIHTSLKFLGIAIISAQEQDAAKLAVQFPDWRVMPEGKTRPAP